MKTQAVALFACLLAGGINAADLDLSRSINQQIKVSGGEFDESITYQGPEIKAKTDQSDELWIDILVKKNKKTGAIRWGMLLQASYGFDWRFYTSVNLAGGKAIDAEKGLRKVLNCYRGSCTFIESAVAWLDADDVRSGIESGLKVRWNASRGLGTFQMEFPAAYFAAMAEASK